MPVLAEGWEARLWVGLYTNRRLYTFSGISATATSCKPYTLQARENPHESHVDVGVLAWGQQGAHGVEGELKSPRPGFRV